MSTQTAWGQMMARCYDPLHPKYPRYGGRGIRVCDRWICRRLFIEDMGKRPEGMSLNRIDNDGPYSPENCAWATPTEQSQNTVNNKRITRNGVTKCISEWERITGIGRKTISKRLASGWDVEKALTVPPSNTNRSMRKIDENHNFR